MPPDLIGSKWPARRLYRKPILTSSRLVSGVVEVHSPFTGDCVVIQSPIIDHFPSFPTRTPLNVFFVPFALTMNSSNITVLTQSHAVAAKKRKAKRDEIQEVVFDDEARRCAI